jgi:FkbM family methyltransferase
MKINRSSIAECASLGGGLRNRLKLGLFGFLAPMFNTSWQCRLRRLSHFVPQRMWLSPKKLGGLQLLIDPTDWSQTVIFEEVFLRSSYDLDKVKFAPSVVIDCGAHIGMFSLLARSRYRDAELITYEPNSRNAEFIRRLIAKNKLTISFFACAISTESAELSFVAVNSHGGRLVSEESDRSQMDDSPVYTVRAVDFTSVLRDIEMDSLLLKMDIEGEERNVLPAIMPLLPRRTALFFETHHGEEGWSEIEGVLTRNGFMVEQINVRGLYCDGFASRS